MLASVIDRIRAPVRWLLLKALFLGSPRTLLDGLEVIDVAGEKSQQTLHGLREALSLLAKADPRRYQRLKRDLRRIVLMKAGEPEFASEVGACIIRSRYVRESDPAAVATTLVHEATHARLERRGIGYGPGIRSRVEKLCVKEQVAFAERLGNTDIQVQLQEKLHQPWWTPSKLHERRMTAWRQLGVPEWALRWYDRVVCASRGSR